MAMAADDNPDGVSDSQASWVGAGWNLDLGHIVRDMNDKPNDTSQHHFSLSLNGVGDELVLGSDSYYHTKSEQFIRVSRTGADTADEAWYVWTKDGTKYTFDKRLGYYLNTGGYYVREWYLTRAEDVNGNAMTITYQDDAAKAYGGDPAKMIVLGTYPNQLTYSEYNSNRYKVHFTVEPRNDVKSVWENDTYNQTPHQHSRLKSIEAYEDLNGSPTDIRSYSFGYDYTSILTQVSYISTTGKLALRSITEKDTTGNNSLPAYTFTYENNLLKTASNGYGGKVTYTYDYTTAGKWRDDDSVDLTAYVPYTGTITGTLFAGSVFTISATADREQGTEYLFAYDGYKTQTVATVDTSGSQTGTITFGGTFLVDPRAKSLEVWTGLDAPPYMLNLHSVKAYWWRTYYRATAKTIDDGMGSVVTYTYAYTSPAMNDAFHSAAIRQESDYPKENTEFRGHARVEQTDPGGNKSVSYFYQDDILKGKPRTAEQYQGASTLLQKTENSFVGAVYQAQVAINGVSGDHFTNENIVLEEGLTIPVTTTTYLDYVIKAKEASDLRGSVQATLSTTTGITWTWLMTATDQNGLSGAWSTDLNSRYAGYWYHRRISLSAFAGMTLTNVLLMTNDWPNITTGQPATYTYYVSSVTVGERVISPTQRSGTSGSNITSWSLAPDPNENVSYPFVRLGEANTYAYDSSSANQRQTRTAYNYDSYGNLTSEYMFGDPGDSADDRTTHHSYTAKIDASTYIVDRLRWDNFYQGITENVGGDALQTQNIYYYDGSSSYGTIVNKGLLTRVEKGKSGDYVATVEYSYDSYGNRTTTFEPGGRVITTTFDSTFRAYPVAETTSPANGVTRREAATYDYRFGKPTVITDEANLTVSSYAYDSFGRTSKVWLQTEPASLAPTKQVTITDGGPLTPTKVLVESRKDMGAGDTPSLQRAWSFYDGRGRLIQTQSDAETAGQAIVKSVGYDVLGRKARESMPITTTDPGIYQAPNWSSSYKTSYAYDALGRSTLITNPDGTVVSTTYAIDAFGAGLISDAANQGKGSQKTVVDANGHARYYTYDNSGRLSWVGEPATEECPSGAYVTAYQYDSLNNLKQVVSGGKVCDSAFTTGAITTTIAYDSQGRKTSMADPDMGTWSYAYDTAGNLVQQADAKGQKMQFAFDNMGRSVAKYDNTAFTTHSNSERTLHTIPDSKEYAGLYNITFTVNAPAADVYSLLVTLHQDISVTNPLAYSAVSAVYIDGGLVGTVSTRGGRGPFYQEYSTTWMLGPAFTERFVVSLASGSHTVYIKQVSGNSGIETAKDGSEIALVRGSQGAFYQYDSHLLDRFDAKDTSLWTFSSRQVTATVDNQTALKSTGSGTGYDADLYRKQSPLQDGDRMQVEFKTDSTYPASYLRIFSGTGVEALGVHLNGGSISATYVDMTGTFSTPTTLLTLDANVWYVLSISLHDDANFSVDVWKRDSPDTRATYTKAMSKWKTWYFRHQLYGAVNVWLDNYSETYARAAGKRTKITDGTGSASYFYDKRGRMTREEKTVDATTFATSYAYDALDRVTSTIYPDGEVLTSTYNSRGSLAKVSSGMQTDYLSDVTYNAMGQIRTMSFGSNPATTQYSYYGDDGPATPTSFRLYQIYSSVPGGATLQKLAYEYDNVGNISKILDHLDDTDGVTETQTYTYDALDRLQSATGNTQGTSVYTQTFAYN